MKPKCLRPLLLTSLLIQALPSSANTEIVNLTPSINPRIPALDSISSNWPVLNPIGGQNERRWSMTDIPREEGNTGGCILKREWCEDDLWLVLDFDAEEWGAYKSFTLRISWPASVCIERLSRFLSRTLIPSSCKNQLSHLPIQHPFDFQLEAYTPQAYALKANLNATWVTDLTSTHPETRDMYARIRPVNFGVLVPWAQRAISGNQTLSRVLKNYGKVEFITILEPLRLGGVPETLLPIIAFLVSLVLIAGFAVLPIIHAYIARIASDVRAELEEKRL